MVRLGIQLLGTTRISLDGTAAHGSGQDKVCALLAYLLVEADRPHRREILAELLWPDQPEGRGRHSLRQALVTLRQRLGDQNARPALLLTSRDSIQVNPDVHYEFDVHTFERHIQALSACGCSEDQPCPACIQHLELAIDTYGGEFLADVTIDGSPAFEAWLSSTRDRLRSQSVSALHQLGECCLRSGEVLKAGDLARRQLAIDPYREEAHRQMMQAFNQAGNRSAALGQYDQCRQVLQEELGIEPEEATITLYEAIRNRSAPHARARGPAVYLPSHSTPFFGREDELEYIQTLLLGNDCRLLTVTGPGGAGKTRLAVEAASRIATSFPNGVYFVSLASLTTRHELVSAIADALSISFADQTDLERALITSLRERHQLLVLDNFEHLIDESDFIHDILEQTSMVRVIVTSRQWIELHEQWVIDLPGLAQPEKQEVEHILESGAARLFIESAGRANTRFVLDDAETLAVGRICRLVDGIPLALELAAAWSPVLSCEEIAGEIAQSIDFLATSFRDVPDRHRNMRAVFDRSWDLLSEREREVFSRLSIFRGGFGRQPAEQVAGADLRTLTQLMSKSLVHRAGRNRYEIHELLRQYGEAKLWSMELDHQQAAQRHSEYYCGLLAKREQSLRGHGQVAALHELSSEIDNIRLAWQWAVDHDRIDLLIQAAHGLWIFLEVSSRYSDVERLFSNASERLRTLSDNGASSDLLQVTMASVLVRYGAVFVRLDNNPLGEAIVQEGCEIARRVNACATLGLGLNFMGMFALERRDYANAAQVLNESIECFKEAGDRWGEAYSTNDLSMVRHSLGDAAGAEALLNHALTLFTDAGDMRGLAFALDNQGVIALRAGRYDEARRHLLRSLEIGRSIQHNWAIATTLTKLGMVTRASGDLEDSRHYLLQALQVAHDVQSMHAILDVLNEIAADIASSGEADQAAQLLTAILRHPASRSSAGIRAGELLAELGLSDREIDQTPDYNTIETFSRELLR